MNGFVFPSCLRAFVFSCIGSAATSLGSPPAVYDQHAAGDVARRVAGEEEGGSLDFLDLSPPFQRRRADDELLAILRE